MNTAKIYLFRRSEETRHEIEAGVQDYEQQRLSSLEQRELTEDELRARYAKNRRPWDRKWGGDCPYKIDANDKVVRGYKDLGAKPSLIDRLMPYILIIGFFGFIYLCVWLGYLLMGVAD